MPSAESTNKIALAITGLYVLAVLLYGYFILSQILLSVIIALVGIAVYIGWQILRGSGLSKGGSHT